MSEPFVGEIRMFGGNFAPRGWAFCNGQLLSVSQNEALFSLIGTIYGGNGRTTFGLPDLRGRAPMHQGSGPGLTPRTIGAKGGNETHYHKTLPLAGNVVAGADPDNAIADSGSNMQPYQCVSFIIALVGIYPSRS